MAYRRIASTQKMLREAPVTMEKILRGAARAGARPIADEAKDLAVSDDVRDNIVIRSKAGDGRIVVRITVKAGWAYSVGTWLEWGTDPHFISVADEQRGGKSIGRINAEVREGSLVIGGKFVGQTVHHPGATPSPFLRPALDLRASEGIAAAQSYINAHAGRGGLRAPSDEGDAE